MQNYTYLSVIHILISEQWFSSLNLCIFMAVWVWQRLTEEVITALIDLYYYLMTNHLFLCLLMKKKVISCCCAIISTTFKALLRYHYSLSLHSAACQSDKIITNCQRIIEVIQKFFSKKYTSICCEYKTIRFKNTVCATKLWTWSNTKYIFTVTVYKITEDDLTWV